MKHPGCDRPGSGVLQAHPMECDPCEEAHQHVGRQQHDHVFLDGLVDIIENLDGNLLFRQRGSGKPDELAFEGVASQQQKKHQEHHR